MIQAKINAFGPDAIAGMAAETKIDGFIFMALQAIALAATTFAGQNYGAKKFDRIVEGYKKGMELVGGIGIFATLLLVFAARPLFTLFTPDDPMAIQEGVRYLRILGLSQFFMSIEIGTTGAFNGLGKTLPPTIVGIILNAMRIPIAIILSSYTALALAGVWWSISLTSIVKGITLVIWFKYILKHKLHRENFNRIIPL